LEFEITHSIASYKGHLKHAHTYRLRRKVFRDFVLTRGGGDKAQPDKEGERYETENHADNA